MAKVGLKYPVYGKVDSNGTITEGKVMAKAIKATVTAESNDVKLYADDGVAESDKSFKGGKILFDVDDLSNEVYADMLGHTYDEETDTVTNKGSDIAPYLAVGFYGQVIKDNVPSYLAKMLYKTQFSEPSDETETKGETTNFQTPTIEGDIFKLDDERWKEQASFSTEAEAKEWLNKKFGISTV